MQNPVRLSLAEATTLVSAALERSGASALQAGSTARALVAAEASGQAGHGLSRVPSYALHARCGKVLGQVVPRLEASAPAVLRVDAGHGFAYPAIDLALEHLPGVVREQGVALAAVVRSHHFGQAGAHAERLAAAGLIGIVLGNTPKAMAFWGGRRAMLGTNPIAFAAPLANGRAPLVIDLALSVAARGKIVAAEQASKPIPEGWALDAEGRATTDAKAALAGSLLPIGGAKGAALALLVEVLAAAVTGSAWGWEASSFFDDRGGPANVGQVLIGIDPERVSAAAYAGRISVLLEALAAEPEVRLPGERRLALRAMAEREGLVLAPALYREIQALAGAL